MTNWIVGLACMAVGLRVGYLLGYRVRREEERDALLRGGGWTLCVRR